MVSSSRYYILYLGSTDVNQHQEVGAICTSYLVTTSKETHTATVDTAAFGFG
jgi:hypothetical protein